MCPSNSTCAATSSAASSVCWRANTSRNAGSSSFEACPVALWEPWGGFVGALGTYWGGFGVAIGCLSTRFDVALMSLWEAFRGLWRLFLLSALCFCQSVALGGFVWSLSGASE